MPSSGPTPSDWAATLLSLLSLLSHALISLSFSWDGSGPLLSRELSRPRPLISLSFSAVRDGWDGFSPRLSGSVLRPILIWRVRRPPGCRSKLISMPTLRRKVAGRRNPRPRASAEVGQFLDFTAF